MFGHVDKHDETVVQALASALRRDISFGVLAPDKKLKIDDLRARYGGSKHSLRETLRLLSAEGLVEAIAQRGFRVTSATDADLQDIKLVRTEIEKLALGRSIDLGDVKWESHVVASHHALRKLEQKLNQQVDDLTALEWDELCQSFSATLCSACESPRLIDLQSKYFDQSRRFRLKSIREGLLDFNQRNTRQQNLLNAIIDRKKTTALDLLEKDIAAELAI